MPRGQPALINPAVLKWARQRSRIPKEVAAKRLGVPVERLTAFESGEEPITLGRVRQCAELYKRSLAVFFLPEPPDEADVPTDYRRLPDGTRIEPSRELVHFIREARVRQAVAIDVARQLGQLEQHRVPYAKTTEHATSVAERLRKSLAYDLDEQMQARGPAPVFRALRSRIEDLGVLVFTAGLDVGEFRGLSLYDAHAPVIAINSQDGYGARNFSLVHELCHLALRREGACNMSDQGRIEVFCNAVAAELLVPSTVLTRQPEVSQHAAGAEWADDDIARLASRFGVSAHVIARRLRDLGRLSQQDYVPYLEQRGSAVPKRSGGPNYYVLQRSRLGVPFIGLVIEGYNRAVLSVADISELLGVKARKLDKLVAALR